MLLASNAPRLRALARVFALAQPSTAAAQDAGRVPDGGASAAVAPEAPEPGLPTRTLRVAVAGNAPFVVDRADALSGISVDVWRATAARLGVDYELESVPNASDAVRGVAAGRYDAAIGPISITSDRAQIVDFSQPYWEASLAILTRSEGRGMWARMKPFLSRAFAGALLALLVVLTLVGTLLWLIERKQNDQFPKKALPGIGVGVWLALVTMTTVGYGDKAPVTLAGRLLTGMWMVIAMLTASSLTAGIATALTLSQLDRGVIETAGELGGQPVATIPETTAHRFVRRYDANFVPVDDVEAAIDKLAAGEIEAVVYDRPILQYHLRQNDALDLRLAEHDYEPQGYGFAFQTGDRLAHEVNVVLLELAESGRLDAIAEEYL